jgi:hypothetical protein
VNRKLIIAAAVAALACGSATAATAASAATPEHGRPACVVVTFGWRTVTGHEADEPVTVCGTGLRHDVVCEVNEPMQPGAVADCWALRPQHT